MTHPDNPFGAQLCQKLNYTRKMELGMGQYGYEVLPKSLNNLAEALLHGMLYAVCSFNC